MARRWQVSEVARMARVTVRTLHHYDEIGLLEPSERSDAGYRLYSRPDLERLHQILLYRELGFTLETIGNVLDEPALDRRTALAAQRELLLEKRRRTDAMIRAVDRALDTMEGGTSMDAEEMFEGLAEMPEDMREHGAKHAREAQERWGETDVYRESMRRVKGFSEDDWEEIRVESEAQEARMAELLTAGADPEGEEAMDTAEAMRRHVGRFYPCSPEMHVGLADMYEADPRFTAHYEERAEGLASYVARAIRANAARAETAEARDG